MHHESIEGKLRQEIGQRKQGEELHKWLEKEIGEIAEKLYQEAEKYKQEAEKYKQEAEKLYQEIEEDKQAIEEYKLEADALYQEIEEQEQEIEKQKQEAENNKASALENWHTVLCQWHTTLKYYRKVADNIHYICNPKQESTAGHEKAPEGAKGPADNGDQVDGSKNTDHILEACEELKGSQQIVHEILEHLPPQSASLATVRLSVRNTRPSITRAD